MKATLLLAFVAFALVACDEEEQSAKKPHHAVHIVKQQQPQPCFLLPSQC
jgi:hypothetical protein